MHFYRSIDNIKAITFDLDDTLYNNSMIVERAEDELIKKLQQNAQLQDLTLARFHAEKKSLLVSNPEIYHDVVVWRTETIKSLLIKAKIPTVQIANIIDESLETFNFWRHQMQVPQATHTLLTRLAAKYPLAVITNGNVEIAKIGLDDYFQFSLRGGVNGRSKPFSEIFALAAQKLAIPTQEILHVGDNLFTDVNGAINSGLSACWLNIFDQDIFHLSDARCLPHIEISQLPELDNLL